MIILDSKKYYNLGSVSMTSDLNGTVSQYIEYIPFGEEMYSAHRNTYNSPYRYTAKELDEETGLYYYGARYYNPKLSIWLSVDPMVEKYISVSPYNYVMNNPINMVDLYGREPTAAEAARMAAHVYGDKKNGILTGGWKVSKRNFGLSKTDLNNSATGLKSQIYERTVKGKTEYTYATAGTEAYWKDVGADIKQPLGLSKQYKKSVKNAKIISDALNKSELTFTGHSLGGGEAALNALLTDRKAITFNAAGVSSITKFAEGTWKTPFKSESKINAYIMTTDPLNIFQYAYLLIPNANGKVQWLKQTDISSTYNGHSMDNVLKNFGVKKPETYDKP